ncbi:mannosylglycerate hydrolase [Hydrogenispora ethanolica]|uniref:Mannosylglycerate hydrolase n=1 Tax=Hydrogenispora ethanolica TaxID=1082276 RepID=A0A4V2QDX4_HYDET|nr:glycoside hydrolase family 38 C-terminal domain-containing protein [Hydrogenispora ethanolica]TCL65927.1 mannosylglycerate hydrolase [Hydrogenispora ethanolica]
MNTMKTAHIISHTHWDREWYLSSKYTNEWLVPFFEALFGMLEKEPAYRFVLDGQTLIIEDYLEQLELQGKDVERSRSRLKKYVNQKRLLIGPYYLQLDWQLVSEEALIRNLLIGEAVARQFGEPMRAGWLLDNFGQISQTVQIHRGFNLPGVFVWRGVALEPEQIRSEFYWEGPDGGKLLAIYFLSSYRNAMRLAERSGMMEGRIRNEVAKLRPLASTANVLLMNGYDQEMEPDDVLPLIQGGMGNSGDFKVIQSIPEEYLAAVQKEQPQLPTLRGALYSGRYISVFPGVLSSRMYLKIQNDRCQKRLEKYAEPLEAILWSLGGEYRRDCLTKAWKLLLQNHPHDSICGVSVDDVHADMEERLECSERIAAELFHDDLRKLAANVDTGGYEAALANLIVVNTSFRQRGGVIAIPDEFPAEISIRDSAGNALPFQRDGGRSLRIGVPEIPALGYESLYVLPGAAEHGAGGAPPFPVTVDVAARVIENRYLRVAVRDDGSLEVTDKLTGTIYHDLLVFEDGADAGDEYNYSYPERDQLITSKERPAAIEWCAMGPLEAGIRIRTVLEVPEGLSPDRKSRSAERRRLPLVTWLTVSADSAVVKFRTTVCNTVKDHRLRVLFPTRLSSEFAEAETQFDVVRRPIIPPPFDDSKLSPEVQRIIIGAREPEPTTIFPQRTFVDIHDRQKGAGAAVLNQGLPEYQILPEQNTIALTLLRGVGWIARPDLLTRTGDAGPMIAVPDAQCLRTMEFNYAFYPHPGDWRTGKVLEAADQFNHELCIVRTDRHPGTWPARLGWLNVESPDGAVKATALKRSEDGTALIVRLHNPAEQPLEATLTSFLKIKKAAYAGLNEKEEAAIAVLEGRTLRLKIDPKQIVTLKLEMAPAPLAVLKREAPIQVLPAEIGEKTAFDESPVPAVTEAEVAREEARAAELERAFAALQARPAAQTGNPGGDGAAARLDCGEWQLEVETYRRASLEARLSAIFLKGKYLALHHCGDRSDRQHSEQMEPLIREIGLKLNKARVSKRLLEYIVDYYRHQLPDGRSTSQTLGMDG